jgi:transcription initiation factor TFIIIB Brf1 subunit/transcription initiation factor TFIIB
MEVSQAWHDFDILRNTHVSETIHKESEYFCSSCGGFKAFDGLEIDLPTCTVCGIVDDAYVSDEPEWHSGADAGTADPSRVGIPTNTDHFSAAWSQTTYMTVPRWGPSAQKRLARINHHSSMNHRDRALFHAYAELDHIGKTILKLPEAVMYSVKIKYKAFNEAVLTRGAVRSGIKANCIFQACREFNVARTTQEIAAAFGIPSRDISRTFDMYQEKLPETTVHITTPADLVSRFFNEITTIPDGERGKLKMKVIAKCKSLEDTVELMGRTPKAIACAVIASVLKGVQGAPDRQTLCRICDISVPTLSKIEAILNS